MDPEDRERQLGETRSLRELRQQLETLASAGARRRTRPRRLVLALGAGVAVAIVLGGVALAGGFDGLLVGASHRQQPTLIFPSGSSVPSPTPYPTNAAGQTYGGAQQTAEADLQSVVAERGENGYCWASDLNGPSPMGPQEAAWLMAVQSRREVAVYKADGVTQVGIFIVGGGSISYGKSDGTTVTKALPNRIAKQPPVWLFDQMKSLATDAGDANAWAWWTLTTADKAAVATGGDSAAGMGDPARPVYVAIILGDFTKWLWSLSEGASAPQYSWIYEVIDAGTRGVDGSGASAKPFGAAEKLELNIVGLRDRIQM